MALWYPRYTKRAIKSFIFLGATLLLLHSFQLLDFSTRRWETWEWTRCPNWSPFSTSCTAARSSIAKDVQVVVKTGGSEPQSRLRAQLATMLSQIPQENILIFSDMEEQIHSHRVHDVYADLSEKERRSYPEFALYHAQQEYLSEGKDRQELNGGWELAKYMNLAMKRKLWTMRQELGLKKWFVVIDTDTFVDWDNLLELLVHHDAGDRVYMGSPVWLPKMTFAHGGSAYVLSYGALEALNSPTGSPDPMGSLHSQYGLNTTALCCGDEALARVLKPKGVSLKGYWPMFNGEIPATLSFGRDLWCEPVVSLHHLSGNEMQDLWQWYEDWKSNHSDPFLFKDLFRYVAPHIVSALEDWENIQDDMRIYPKGKTSHKSWGHCKMACEADKLCFQYLYDGTVCALSHHVRLGRRRLPNGGGAHRYTSGWMTNRIRDWTSKTTCANAHWVRSNP